MNGAKSKTLRRIAELGGNYDRKQFQALYSRRQLRELMARLSHRPYKKLKKLYKSQPWTYRPRFLEISLDITLQHNAKKERQAKRN